MTNAYRTEQELKAFGRGRRTLSTSYEAGADLKTVQELLGHSSIVVTADTYTSVLPVVRRKCAEATAKLVLNAARRTRKKIKTRGRRNRPGTPKKTGAHPRTGPRRRRSRRPAARRLIGSHSR